MNEGNLKFFLRIPAFILDVAACIYIGVTGGTHLANWLTGTVDFPPWADLAIGILGVLLVPFLMMVLPTALLGRTLGKWIFRLRFCRADQTAPGLFRAFLRELTKVLSFVFFGPIGPFVAFVQAGMGKPVYYDGLCGTDIECVWGLTKTQRKFRRHYGKY